MNDYLTSNDWNMNEGPTKPAKEVQKEEERILKAFKEKYYGLYVTLISNGST